MTGFQQKPLRLRNAFLASLQGLLPEPWMYKYLSSRDFGESRSEAQRGLRRRV